ncbi:MAG: MerR family transcriptional regulator [Thermotogota bacterium]
MKIGEFADRYNLSRDTVRYYIDNGMIIPEKIHNRYHFDKTCEKSMDFILQFKKMKFTIEEIKHILTYMRMLPKAGKAENEYLLSIIQNKIDQVIKEKTEYEFALKELEKVKSSYENELKNAKTLYKSYSIPIDILGLLACPKCQTSLKLNNASIENNKIENGDLYCECGYNAKIDSGIIVTDDADKKAFHKSHDEEIAYKSIVDENDSEYLSFLMSPSYWMEKRVKLEDLHNKNIILLRPIGHEISYRFIEKVKNANIFITDYQYLRIKGLKKRMERTDLKSTSNVIFMSFDYMNIPLKNNTFDYAFDLSGMINYVSNYNKSPIKNFYEILKNKGLFFSTFFLKESTENMFVKEVKYLDKLYTRDFIDEEYKIFEKEESAVIQGSDFKTEIDSFMKRKARLDFFVFKGRKIVGDD